MAQVAKSDPNYAICITLLESKYECELVAQALEIYIKTSMFTIRILIWCLGV